MALKKKIGIAALVLVVLVLAVIVGVFAAAKFFVGQEGVVRTAWEVDVGELLGRDEALELEVCQAPLESELSIIQLVPFEVDEEGFTY